MVHTSKITIQTKGFCDIVDITPKVEQAVVESGIKDGLALVFVTGSTAAVTTIEMNANLEEDLKEALELIAPQSKQYHHDEKWGDGNGFSHVRASLVGPSLSVPIEQGNLLLGTWQQTVVADFDNRPRSREVVIKIIGEKK